MYAPIGMYTNPSRRTGFAAVAKSGVRAGTIASSKGSAKDVPTPRSIVRLERAFFVTIISISSFGTEYW
jgi:hypothetical protein